jgi:hypothetical protein
VQRIGAKRKRKNKWQQEILQLASCRLLKRKDQAFIPRMLAKDRQVINLNTEDKDDDTIEVFTIRAN